MLTNANGIALIRGLPADRLLPETDAPFTLEGKLDKSYLISGMTAQLAATRDNDVDDIRSVFAENAMRVFEFAGIKRKFDPRL